MTYHVTSLHISAIVMIPRIGGDVAQSMPSAVPCCALPLALVGDTLLGYTLLGYALLGWAARWAIRPRRAVLYSVLRIRDEGHYAVSNCYFNFTPMRDGTPWQRPTIVCSSTSRAKPRPWLIGILRSGCLPNASNVNKICTKLDR